MLLYRNVCVTLQRVMVTKIRSYLVDEVVPLVRPVATPNAITSPAYSEGPREDTMRLACFRALVKPPDESVFMHRENTVVGPVITNDIP